MGETYARLYELCNAGDLAGIQALGSELTPEIVRMKNNYALRIACYKGNLKFVQWIVEHFGLVAEDVHVGENKALQQACRSGHFNIAQWLIGHFNLDPKVLGADKRMERFMSKLDFNDLGPKYAAMGCE